MKDFKTFYTNLLENPSMETQFRVQGKVKTIKAMGRFTAKNYLEEEYVKIYLKEGGYLLIIPQDEEVYFSDQLLHSIEGISDEVIGREEIILYKGKKYKLANKDDYQFVLEMIVGSPLDIEGECRFSDYFPINGPKEFLSLGWLVRTGERADLNCQIIDVKEIEFIETK